MVVTSDRRVPMPGTGGAACSAVVALQFVERVDVAQRREDDGERCRRSPSVMKPPPAIASGSPKARAATPLSNAPSSFDAPMNTPFDRADTPELVVGCHERHDRPADVHRDHVGCGDHDERDEGHRVALRSARTPSCRGPKMATTTSSVGPTLRRIGRTASQTAINAAPMPGRGAQPSVGDVADVQLFLGDGRDQRDGPAEQHGEQVERDGGQHDRGLAPTKWSPSSAFDHRRSLGELVLLAAVGDHQDRHDRRELEDARERVGDRRADAVEESAEHRSDDRRGGERRRSTARRRAGSRPGRR